MKASEITPHSRVWLEINLDTIERNYRHIQEAVKPLKVLAVLKANAYGLGVEKIAERLDCAGAAGFCVAELKEALPLVKFGKPVQILGAVLDYEIPAAVANHIILGILETGVLSDKPQTHIPHGTVTVLCYDDFRHTAQVTAIGRSINLVIFGTVNEAHHIGILLDGTGFTKVTQLGTLAFLAFTVLHTTVQLRQSDDRNVQLLGQTFQ